MSRIFAMIAIEMSVGLERLKKTTIQGKINQGKIINSIISYKL
ncbi:hypothetical protein HOLDEFILI_00830 [Holdemania filiformis DSM 12042]|uniref:Uncharacterized protein n=1 Tax=Holdemania filiformis DSM 12042 TaxID=545696 RepID=B9Y4U9_9FIRM|nr:hypothetical protein HOLDEFILI_00830 [Holdemania filiformis DSM 12042]